MSEIRLIVGLGNPGPEYQDTRHNAGALFVEALAAKQGATLNSESKFFGDTARINLHGHDIRLLIPTTFMNRSGQAIAAMAQFYKMAPEEILVAHDELDIEVGTARFKKGGGHGGHNGLRDTIARLGNNANFHRLRIGIGHPGSAARVTGHVLSKAPATEHDKMLSAIDAALNTLPLAVDGDWAKAMQQLHSYTA